MTFVSGGVALTGSTPNPAPLSAGTASFTISTLSVGKHKITAVYSGDGNFAVSTSPSVTHKVTGTGVAPGAPIGDLAISGFGDLGAVQPRRDQQDTRHTLFADVADWLKLATPS